MKVVIGIKALNEAENIAGSIESALAALAALGPDVEGEVILADSGSTDGTVEIASAYPVRVVQLTRREDGCCGAGAQLAFQTARGDYFYLLDGDMRIDRDMLVRGIAYLDQNPNVAGVGGSVIEQNLSGHEFQVRAQKAKAFEGPVDSLDCGGLYRMKALREAGYLADRNLHSFEEFDLGARLAAQGWTLARVAHPGVYHYGHKTDGYRLLWRRLRTGYAGGLGEIVRGAIGRPHLHILGKRLKPLQMAVVVLVWWAALAVALLSGAFTLFLILFAIPILFLSFRRRSIRLGLYSFATCNVLAMGLISGLLRPRISPSQPLAYREVEGATDHATVQAGRSLAGNPA